MFINNTFMVRAFHFSYGMDHDLLVVNNVLYKPTDFYLVEENQVWHNILNQTEYFAGVNGNIDADPMFREPRYDFRLAPNSPAIDRGLSPLPDLDLLDRDGVPRILDGDLDLLARVDMGAFEFAHADLTVGGDARPGGSLVYDVDSYGTFDGLMIYGLTEVSWDTAHWGTLMVDPIFGGRMATLGSLPTQWTLPLPNEPGLIGQTILAQVFAYDPASSGGGFSNLIRTNIVP